MTRGTRETRRRATRRSFALLDYKECTDDDDPYVDGVEGRAATAARHRRLAAQLATEDETDLSKRKRRRRTESRIDLEARALSMQVPSNDMQYTSPGRDARAHCTGKSTQMNEGGSGTESDPIVQRMQSKKGEREEPHGYPARGRPAADCTPRTTVPKPSAHASTASRAHPDTEQPPVKNAEGHLQVQVPVRTDESHAYDYDRGSTGTQEEENDEEHHDTEDEEAEETFTAQIKLEAFPTARAKDLEQTSPPHADHPPIWDETTVPAARSGLATVTVEKRTLLSRAASILSWEKMLSHLAICGTV